MKKRTLRLLSIALITLLAIPQNALGASIDKPFISDTKEITVYFSEKNGERQAFTKNSQGAIIPGSIYTAQNTISTNSNIISNLATNNAQKNILKDQLVQQSLTNPSELIYDDTSSFLKYTGSWATATNASNEGGTAKTLNNSGKVSFSFTGSSVKWTGFKDPTQGIGRVVIDGVTQGEVDLYAAYRSYKQLLFEKSLNFGLHTMEIHWEGTPNKNGKAKKKDPAINIDTIKINTSAPKASAPSITSSTGHASNISLTFKNNDKSAEQLFIYKSIDGSNFTLLSTCNISDSKDQEFWFEDKDVLNNVIYNYYVTAANTIGESEPSNTVTNSKITTNCVYNLEDINSNVNYTGTWDTESIPNDSGGTTHVTVEAGSKVSIPFTAFESRIKLISGPDMGIARIHWSNANEDYYDANLHAPSEDYLTFGTSSNMQTSSNWVIECVSGKIAFDVEENWNYTTVAPIQPENLKGVLENSDISLVWDISTELDLQGYNVYRKATADSDYILLNQVPISSAQFTDTSVLPNEDYTYVVKAVNYANLESTASTEVIITHVITAPTELVGTLTGTSAILNWAKHSDPVVTQYNIYRSTTSGSNYELLDSVLNPILTYTDSTVVVGTTYYYAISAVSGNEVSSNKSNEVTVVVPQVITVPTGLIGTLSGTSAVLNWTNHSDPAVTQYNIYRSTTSGLNYELLNTVLNPVLTFTDPTVVAGSTYYYVITAVSGTKEESIKSNEVRVVVPAVVTAPVPGTSMTPLIKGIYEETNPNIKYVGKWLVENNVNHSGSSAKYSATSGNYIEFSFTGTGFRWITPLNKYRGIAKVTVDGASFDVDNYSVTAVFQKVVYEKTDLTLGTHTVKIEVTPGKNASSYSTIIAFDAVEILHSEESPAVPVPDTGGTPLIIDKYEDTSPNIKYVGNWLVDNNVSHSGSSAKYSATSGNYIEFSFTGTGFRWITPLNKYRGIAKVTVDGVSSDVDNYSVTTLFQKVVYEKTDLTMGIHTVKIEVTPDKNPSSSSIIIALDAVEILSSQVAPTIPVPETGGTPIIVNKYEETSPNIKFVGKWLVDNNIDHSGSSAMYSSTAGNYIEFSFTGTGFRWITPLNKYRGIAKVTVDGIALDVDNYSVTTVFQKVVYENTNLTLGTHTVKIEVTPDKNPTSSSIIIAFDAVEILSSQVAPTIPVPETGGTTLTVDKYEETSPNIKYVGNWIVDNNASHSGSSAKYSATPGNYIEFSFTGTGFRWITPLNKYRGIAKITVDGVSSDVDNYSATTVFQKVIYENTNLTLGSHTVKIEVTPNKNSLSSSIIIAFDAVEILSSVESPAIPEPSVPGTSETTLTVGNYEETNANIKFVGTWLEEKNPSHSGSSAKYSSTAGDYIEFSFTGTGFRWITPLNKYRGIAKVTVDGISYNIDNYSTATEFQKVIYENTNLTLGTHTVRIEVTPDKHASSRSIIIAFDAVEILN